MSPAKEPATDGAPTGHIDVHRASPLIIGTGAMMRGRTFTRFAALSAAIVLLTTGCLSAPAEFGSGGTETGDKSVEVFGAFGGDEAKAFEEALVPFEQQTGIDVTYIPSTDFTTLIRSRVAGQRTPDIAIFPQPGLLQDLAKRKQFVALDDILDLNQLKSTLLPGMLDSTTVDGKVYGAPMRLAVKSLVWYPVPEFTEAGYTIPKTHQELVALTNKIKADGKTPWCIGMESGAGTGWVGTDWLEEYVLRIGGPEKYRQWVTHEITFEDPIVKRAALAWAELQFAPGNALGGQKSIVSTNFGSANNPMFDDPPGCYLHRQGNFITGFFPDNIQEDLTANVDFFLLPPYEGGFDGQPILNGGDLAALFNSKDPDAVEVMKFITSDKFGGPWAKAGGWLSPHKTFDASLYSDEVTKKVAALAAQGDAFAFDASDTMPGSVGNGTFWRGMVDWVAGQKNLDTVLKDIDASWPEQ
jgi:alpha-glucoside transport system substrate-binding protein